MNKVEVLPTPEGIPYEDAPTGCFFEVLDKDRFNGYIGKKPWCENQSVVFLNLNTASTDCTMGIKRVRVLTKGESFKVTIG